MPAVKPHLRQRVRRRLRARAEARRAGAFLSEESAKLGAPRCVHYAGDERKRHQQPAAADGLTASIVQVENTAAQRKPYCASVASSANPHRAGEETSKGDEVRISSSATH